MPPTLAGDHVASGRLRHAAGRTLALSWWGCALLLAGTGFTAGLLTTPGPWLASMCALAALLGTLAAMGIAAWQATPLTAALVPSIVGAAVGCIAVAGLGRLFDSGVGPGVGPVVGGLMLAGLPLAVPAFQRCLDAERRDPCDVQVFADARARLADERARPQPPGAGGWVQADERWLTLIAATPTAQPRGGRPRMCAQSTATGRRRAPAATWRCTPRWARDN